MDSESGNSRDGQSPKERENRDATGGSVLASVVSLALAEDIGPGDETTRWAVPPDLRARGVILSRVGGILSGLEPAAETVRQVDPEVVFAPRHKDGDPIRAGEIVAVLEGRAQSLLRLERVCLNFLQRLSGVATLTAYFVAAIEGTGVAIADTRKTTPGLRFLEKAAVRHGGGINHRFGLYDACMVKDNHIVAAGSITAAVEHVRRGFYERGRTLHLTVEAKNVAEAEEAARLGVDQILLDNMGPSAIAEAVAAIRRIEEGVAEAAGRLGSEAPDGKIRIEVSGGVTLVTIRARALPGVDLISVGALTHSAPALDIAMDIELLTSADR